MTLQDIGRFPRGKRGLKSGDVTLIFCSHKSLPPREAWIEIAHFLPISRPIGRFPRGKRGLKY